MTDFDFTITQHRGGLCLIYPWSQAADEWIAEHTANCKTWSSWGDGFAIECNRIAPVVENILENGLVIEGIEK